METSQVLRSTLPAVRSPYLPVTELGSMACFYLQSLRNSACLREQHLQPTIMPRLYLEGNSCRKSVPNTSGSHRWFCKGQRLKDNARHPNRVSVSTLLSKKYRLLFLWCILFPLSPTILYF
jgi:hypothetical protein